jgi:hopene-associated glycosyltransferase HpnB
MEFVLIIFLVVSALSWLGFALLPWRSWSTQETLDAPHPGTDESLSDVTVVIPARNEGDLIERTLRSVVAQGAELKIVLVDDGSQDDTVEKARQLTIPHLTIIPGAPLVAGWNGKLWALEQGRRHVSTPYTLFLDADIELAPGILCALKNQMAGHSTSFASLLAAPHMMSLWEKFLMPAFVYFFKALYPFAQVNSAQSNIAAAAGGCILLESALLERIGGFASVKFAVIDDCSFAQRVKSDGSKIWLGLSHSVQSLRGYRSIREIADMIARCAFAQLHWSPLLLIVCTVSLLTLYALPVFMALASEGWPRYLASGALTIMVLTYAPTLHFYRRSLLWAFSLPLCALFYLAMTWLSALRYWRGERTRWKGRVYERAAAG